MQIFDIYFCISIPSCKSTALLCIIALCFPVALSGIIEQSHATKQGEIYFNCNLTADEGGDCLPSSNPVSTNITEGKVEKIYDVATNSADYVNGKYGKALNFHGYLGEYVTLAQNRNITFNQFAVSFWVKEEPWFTTYAPIISTLNSASNAGWLFDVQNNGTAIRFGVSNENGTVNSPEYVPVQPGNFVHIAGTFDGSSTNIYRNGTLYSSQKYSGTYVPNSNVQLRLGLDSFDNENSWAGDIDDLRFFNRAISQDEVKLIYENSNMSSSNLVGHWPFDDTLDDVSGNNNNAILRLQTASMVFAPDGRMFFTEKRTGEVRIMENNKVLSEPFVKIPKLYLGDHIGLLGMTLDPEFDKNHFVYVYSTHIENDTSQPFNRVLRFTDTNNMATNMTVLIDKIPADISGYYGGGALSFGPDDKLYVTVGIGSLPLAAQNVSSVLGKVLRINRDGTIPSDNPFPNSPIYTLGHRNMFGIAFDKNTGTGIVTENGDVHYDEINLIQKGGNYGFPSMQNPTMDSAISANFLSPVRTYYRPIAPAQAIFYDGAKFPQLHDNFVIASYNDGNLRGIKIYKNESAVMVMESVIYLTHEIPDNIAAVAQSPSGDLYLGGYSIYKLVSIGAQSTPSMLSLKTYSSPGIGLEDIKFVPETKTILMNFTANDTNRSPEGRFITMKIPKILKDENSSISVVGCQKSTQPASAGNDLLVQCNIGENVKSDQTLVSINLNSEADSQMSVNITGEHSNREIHRPEHSG